MNNEASHVEEEEEGFNFDPNSSEVQPEESFQEPRRRRHDANGKIN